MFETTKELTVNRWMAVAMPDERIFGLYLGTALLLALATWLYYRYLAKAEKPDKIDKGALAFIFDKEVFFHRSAKQDFWYFVVNGAIYAGLISQLLISTHFFMMIFYSGFQNFFGVYEESILTSSLWILALYTIVYALFLDFAIFITHYMQHKIPVLWEFHKVHHSAEVLTPLTLYRMHPVDLFLSGIVASLLAGLAFAGFYYMTGETPRAYEVMGVNIIVFAFYLFGYNLRHSHIWLSYPAWLSHILISPAQHQIHHSVEPKHFDKNLGLIFAFWDKLFGTLYVPRTYEKLSYGINKKKPNPFNSVADFYIQPFKRAWKIICPERTATKVIVVAAIGFFLIANYTVFFSLDRTILSEKRPLPSVHIADLTWTEVARALERGYDTVIIPTGGVEQNGPHMILGKHNHVVTYAAGEIAKRLGGTLVAPAITYVPEDVHMDYAGTVGVPDHIFEGILKAAAESYVAHGFKNILFIGDSQGNQAPQEEVAAALTARWKDQEGVTIAHIGDYYSANGQIQWLMEQGYSLEQIGGHAGIRDTSEIMYVHAKGIRTDPWLVKDRDSGHNGDPTLASKKIGEVMVNLKIDAALAQINRALGDRKAKPEAGFVQLQYVQP